jgi:hypothetical protein
VYAYESEAGYIVHVAQYKTVYSEPLPPHVEFEPHFAKAWLDRHRAVSELHDRSDKVLIDLPYAGESFREDSLEALLERLKRLREIGYRVPEFAIMVVENEIWEKSDDTQI